MKTFSVDKRNVMVSVEEGYVESVQVLQGTPRQFYFKVKDPDLRLLKEIIVTYENSDRFVGKVEKLKLTSKNTKNFTEFTYTIQDIQTNIQIDANTIEKDLAVWDITLVDDPSYTMDVDKTRVEHGGSATLTVRSTNVGGKNVISQIIVDGRIYEMDGEAGEKMMLLRDITDHIEVSAVASIKKFKVTLIESVFCKVNNFEYIGESINVTRGDSLVLTISPDPDTEFVEAFVNNQVTYIISNQISLPDIQGDKNIRVIYKQKPYIVFTDSPGVNFTLTITEGASVRSINALQDTVYTFTSNATIDVRINTTGAINRSYSSNSLWYLDKSSIIWTDLLSDKNWFIFDKVTKPMIFKTTLA